jgi:eukaryotic-like serine/threonine-protein kinase
MHDVGVTDPAQGEPGQPLRPGDPQHVGAYRLRRLLGTGGMGTVYLASGPDGQPVAVKVMNDAFRDDPQFRERFAREVSAASRVASFCTAKVLHADPKASVPYLVIEYVPGSSLHEYVRRNGPLRGNVEALAVGVAAALTAIHAVGLAHGDLKPRNVLLSPFGPKVVDFGVARIIGRTGPIGAGVFGTPGWLAPEQLAGHPPSPASDVFAWGLLVVWAATGQPAYGAKGPAGTVRAPHPAPDLAELTKVSPRLAELAGRALHPDPARRPPARDLLLSLVGRTDAPSVQAALAPLTRPLPAVQHPPVQHAPVQHVPKAPLGWRPPGPPPPPPAAFMRRRPRRRRRLFGYTLTLLLGLCLIAALRSGDGDPSADPGTGTSKRPPSRSAADGKLRFTVTGLTCGTAKVGKEPFVKHAQGQFCLLSLRVENIGKDGARVWVGNQRLYDTHNREYKADEFAVLYYEGTRPFAESVGPGNVVTGTLAYDVPKGDVAFRKLIVRDSPFSFGTTIELG